MSKGEFYSWGPREAKRPCLYGFSLTSGGWVGLSWEVTGRQWLCLGGRRQIWYMALSPGQKDLARVDRQQDVPPRTASLHSRLGVEAGGETQPHSVPSFFGEKQVVVSGRVCAPRGYLAQGSRSHRL